MKHWCKLAWSLCPRAARREPNAAQEHWNSHMPLRICSSRCAASSLMRMSSSRRCPAKYCAALPTSLNPWPCDDFKTCVLPLVVAKWGAVRHAQKNETIASVDQAAEILTLQHERNISNAKRACGSVDVEGAAQTSRSCSTPTRPLATASGKITDTERIKTSRT